MFTLVQTLKSWTVTLTKLKKSPRNQQFQRKWVNCEMCTDKEWDILVQWRVGQFWSETVGASLLIYLSKISLSLSVCADCAVGNWSGGADLSGARVWVQGCAQINSFLFKPVSGELSRVKQSWLISAAVSGVRPCQPQEQSGAWGSRLSGCSLLPLPPLTASTVLLAPANLSPFLFLILCTEKAGAT